MSKTLADEVSEAQTVVSVDVHRHSWWKSHDDKRLMIVVGIWHTRTPKGTDEATSYDVLEVGETSPMCLSAKMFVEQIRSGLLVWVRRPPDAPAPPDLIRRVGSL